MYTLLCFLMLFSSFSLSKHRPFICYENNPPLNRLFYPLSNRRSLSGEFSAGDRSSFRESPRINSKARCFHTLAYASPIESAWWPGCCDGSQRAYITLPSELALVEDTSKASLFIVDKFPDLP